MDYRIYTPSRLLSTYVKYYWTLEAFETSRPGHRERIFPDGCIELLFHYGDVFRNYSDQLHAYNQPRGFIHGQLRSFIEVQSTGKIGIFSIRFRPEGLRPFLKMGVNEFAENVVSVRDLWGADGLILEEKIIESRTSGDRIRIIEEFLVNHLQHQGDRSIQYCVQAILNTGNPKSIEMLSRDVSLGRRQLERKFIAAVGLSPKLLSRITRFQHALQSINRNSASSLTDIALLEGFYDQSHFIRDFKEFTGLNPKQYFTADLEFAKHLANT